jgi:hypothetical protein
VGVNQPAQQWNEGGENYQVFTGPNNQNFFGGTHYHGRPLPSPQGTPNNLKPSGAVAFVGRADALGELEAQLQGSGPLLITALKGMGGIGKSELALRYALASLEAGTYSDGILWIEGRGADLGTQIVDLCPSPTGPDAAGQPGPGRAGGLLLATLAPADRRTGAGAGDL